jgi:hypothetical protein
MSNLNRAERWRQRAEELRATAVDMRDRDVRETLLYFAADLDAMAERLEGGERANAGRFAEASRSRQ